MTVASRRRLQLSGRHHKTRALRDSISGLRQRAPRRSRCRRESPLPPLPPQPLYCARFTHTQQFNGLWSGTTRVGRYQKKHSPTHTVPDHRTYFINSLNLLRSIASSLFNLSAWQSFSTTSLQVLFGLPLGLGPSTSYSMHFFAQASSSIARASL